jgi:nitroimidazol reductase NimA-like FMN-containing flavoprotein (pyridoxamine 5'-phosphate oxidase superfamily)
MKVIQATSQIPGMTKGQVDIFLESKLNLQLATIDERGWPNIHPVWFYYDKNEEKLLITTSKLAKKTQNLRDKPNVYFSIDDETSAPKGVKGRGTVTIIEDPSKTLSAGDKMSIKYLGTLDHPVAKMITDGAKKGEVILIEISPKFFSTWNYSRVQ